MVSFYVCNMRNSSLHIKFIFYRLHKEIRSCFGRATIFATLFQ